MSTTIRMIASAALMAGLLLPSIVIKASADEATLAEIESTFGTVPTFLRHYPAAALPGAWQTMKALELSEETELSPKVKQLIGLAVAAQVPCSYCVWAHTLEARNAGATDGEIQEAVAIAAYTRHWSTVLNGMQIDLEGFKSELGGPVAATD